MEFIIFLTFYLSKGGFSVITCPYLSVESQIKDEIKGLIILDKLIFIGL